MIRTNVVITEYKNKICTMTFHDSQLEDLHVETDTSLLGNIYIAKVKNINKNIHAAFVELFDGQKAFLPLDEITAGMVIRSSDGRICEIEVDSQGKINLHEGDELPVQVIREGVKTKDPVATAKLSLNGAYCVVTLDRRKGGFQYSKKLSHTKKKELQTFLHVKEQEGVFPHFNQMGCAVVIRTGVENLPDFLPVENELQVLLERMREILFFAKTRTCFNCIHTSKPSYIEYLHHHSQLEYEEIVTDLQKVYENLETFYKGNKPIRFYNDTFPLGKLYSLDSKMDELFAKKINLKSGANLIIEYTEAMTVIDVNTAKCIAKKDKDTLNYKINLEAAEEIARQLRLRNLSGIIMVDFINMENEQYRTELIQELKKILKKDPVACNYVDMTALGLVEITRKKVQKPVHEVF